MLVLVEFDDHKAQADPNLFVIKLFAAEVKFKVVGIFDLRVEEDLVKPLLVLADDVGIKYHSRLVQILAEQSCVYNIRPDCQLNFQ